MIAVMQAGQRKYTPQETIQIYTDWANHYLEKGRSKRRVSHLASDCSDGILLADVIESVTNTKIPDINRKPKNSGQMLDNINICINALKVQHVAGIEDICASDLQEGRLKAVLALFFALSRHKQATKHHQRAVSTNNQLQQHQQQHQVVVVTGGGHIGATTTTAQTTTIAGVANKPRIVVTASSNVIMAPHNMETHITSSSRALSTSSNKINNGTTSIPLPGSALPTRRCPPDKIRPTSNGGSTIVLPQQSTVPATTCGMPVSNRASSPAMSMIPRVGLTSITTNTSNNTKVANKCVQQQQQNVLIGTYSGKRTSSSSGISSSAKSEKSDSNFSLDSNTTKNLRKPIQNPAKPQQTTKLVQQKSVQKQNISVTSSPSSTSTVKSAPPSSKLSEPKIKINRTTNVNLTKSNNTKLPTLSNTTANNSATGIPKPTAAVKGTSKVIRDERRLSGVPLPVKESTLTSTSNNETMTAVVSPIQNESTSATTIETQNSQLSESSHSVSTGQHSNSSESSSVIYRPSSESGSEQQQQQQQQQKNIDKPLNNVLSSMVTHTRDSSLGSTGECDDDVNLSLLVKPMMPLMRREYCNNLTMPTIHQRTHSSSRHQYNNVLHNSNKNATTPLDTSLSGSGDYCDIEEIVNGYMSDGELIRSTNDYRVFKHQKTMFMNGQEHERRRIINNNGLIHHLTDIHAPRIPIDGPQRSLTVLTEQSRPHRGVHNNDDVPPPLGPRPTQHLHHLTQSPNRQNISAPSTASIISDTHWKKYTDSPGVGTPIESGLSSPTSNRRDKNKVSKCDKSSSSSSSKVRVPQSFGYVKRNSVGSTTTQTSTNSNGSVGGQSVNSKTAQVSVVPRTKVKVSGGTQTCTSDIQQTQTKITANSNQYKSYSLTGHAASQLSQSVRERLMMGSQSLPKGALTSSGLSGSHEYGLVLRQPRPKASDGSLSDTQATENPGNSYAPWLRHSNTYSMGARLSENESLENLANFHGHRSSLTHSRLLRDSTPSGISSSARLSRSNSIRSTKSEKLYPSMLHRGAEIESEPYYCLPVGALHWSQPASPAPGGVGSGGTVSNSAGNGSPHLFPLSPTHGIMSVRHSNTPKNDDVHGSSVSLVSTTSSLYSSAEEKQAHEIRKLRRELIDAQEKVHTLTSQLTTNAHVVSAFEQSLLSMTQRLQHLTATAERKDTELSELRTAMEMLRAQSLQAGLGQTVLVRQPSSDSVSSMSSACSLDKQDKKKKKGWLRSSFTKAFSRNSKQAKVQTLNSTENGGTVSSSNSTATVSNDKNSTVDDLQNQQTNTTIKNSSSNDENFTDVEVEELQKQLREKDLVLTDIRLEALSSAHQLESLKDTVMKMRSEMLSLKQNNERLQRMVGVSMHHNTEHDTLINHDPPPDVIAIDENAIEPDVDGKRISISVYLGQPSTFDKYYADNYKSDVCQNLSEGHELTIAFKKIGSSISWGQLDVIVRRSFKQHVARLDPINSLGLGGDSVARYRLGDAERSPTAHPPDLLPVGYIVGRVCTLHIILQPVCALAFEALIPRSVAQRLATLLSEHRRVILCGPPGTGKTHLAQRLAEFYVQNQGKDPSEAIANFNVDHKSGKELRQYLAHLGEQASEDANNSVLPCVVVLDNLHRAGPLNEALGALSRTLPCLIGTMAQAACSTTNLQLQHGFRWILIAPHLEPASGLLGRVLRRRLTTLELTQGERPDLAAVLNWLPRVWKHLNKFLETHSSGDVTIGPRLFLACPLDMDASKAWFSDVWNYSLAPYLREAAKEGIQLYGKRAPWVDPVQFIIDTYPWAGGPPQSLTRITPQDVGLEKNASSMAHSSDCDSTDPLLNMLMRLQEAANYSSPHSNDSDCASLDLTNDSSVPPSELGL